jgi:hypothetical protein
MTACDRRALFDYSGSDTVFVLNMFLARALFILCVTLVCNLIVSDIGPAAFIRAFGGLMEWAGAFRSTGRAHQGPED